MTLPTDSKARKDIPIGTGFCDYFPDAIVAVAELSRIGNDQHNPGQPLHWDRGKSTDESDALMRHFLERGTVDADGVRHSTKVAWRAMALLQKELETERAKPKSMLDAICACPEPPTTSYTNACYVPAAGEMVEVKQQPGESIHEAICRTAREAHGLPLTQPEYKTTELTGPKPPVSERWCEEIKKPESRFGFTVGERVNHKTSGKGANPGRVTGFTDTRVLVRWDSWDGKFNGSAYTSPKQLRHGE